MVCGMNAVIFEHVRVSELPAAWRAKLSSASFALKTQVTVRIEEEAASPKVQAQPSDMTANPLFGMWRDRQDMADVPAYVRKLRTPRLKADGSRRKR
jgi:hypothetical protein